MARNHNQNLQQEHQKDAVQEEKEPQSIESNEQEANTASRLTDSPPKFVSRISSIPVVQDSLSTVQTMANKTSLGRLALSTASSTLMMVSKYKDSHPKYIQSYYESYIQSHIEKIDAFGCHSLDMIENKFPVVTQPTEEIVRAVTVPSCQMIDGVKVKIDSSITQPAHHVAEQANKRFGTVVDNVEAVIDHYLPPSDVKKREKNEEVNQALRAYGLLNDATLRLSLRVQDQVRSTTAQVPSPSQLAHLAATSTLIQNTTVNLHLMQDSLTAYAQQHLPPALTERIHVLQESTQIKLQLLTGQVASQLQQMIDCFKNQSNQTPEWLKSRIALLVDITNKQMDLLRTEYGRQDISGVDKARNVAASLQSQVLPVLQNIQDQLNHYTQLARQKASQDLKIPFEFLGLTHAPKLAHA